MYIILKTLIPYFNRSYVGRKKLVRFVGMVQDMMDPEYYVTKDDDGRCMKYKDAMTTSTIHLAERQPMVLVPLPFVSDWFQNNNTTIHSNTNTVVEANTCSKNTRKRPYNLTTTTDDDDDGCSTMSKKQLPVWDSSNYTNSNDSSSNNSLDQNPNTMEDWWPQGCMGSQPDQCAILAKVDYHDFPNKKKLQLNTIVQVIGILGTTTNANDIEEDCSINNDNMMMDLDVWEDAFVQIPSSLPRLFVLQYQPLELNSMTLNHLPTPFSCDDRSFTIQMLNEYVFHGNHIVAAEALLVTLLSMAERNKVDGTAIQMPSGSTLGCASLKFLVENDTFSFCHTLQSVLKQLLPIVTKVDLYLSVLNASCQGPTTSLHPIAAPEKNHYGRMDPSIMQLPKSSCMILNEGALTPGSLHTKGQRALECFSKLTQHHSIPYQFGGMMEIPFEADYRMIVVSKSTQTQQLPNPSDHHNKLMPCHLVMKVGKIRIEDNNDGRSSTCTLPLEAATRIRKYLAKCRSHGNVDLSQDVLKTAERVFLGRRQSHKESVGEDDFHRWLTLTRLQARSRQQQMAQLEDWSAALQLDDSMLQSMS